MATTDTKNSVRYEYTSNPNNGEAPTSLAGLVKNFKDNFLKNSIEIVPGLTFNQYETVKRVYYYQHNQFMSGPKDENGDPKYFYDLVTDRNDQATKNIDLDTKDCYIKATTEGAELKSWLLRREFMAYAKETGFDEKMNQVADELPDFGTVVWKKCKYEGRTDVMQVDLINVMNDPAVKCLKDGIMIERHTMTQSELRSYGVWDQDAVEALIAGGNTVPRGTFLDTNQATVNTAPGTRVDKTTPFYEVYELWGEIPLSLYQRYETGGKQRGGIYAADVKPAGEPGAPSTAVVPTAKQNESVYVMAIVAGVDNGGKEQVLFCKKATKEQFPYKEVHFRRRKGRWLGVGNYERCFDLTEKANEITNRFFASLRISLLHLYQTRDQLHVKNFLTDLLDGDLVVSKSEISAIPTELRGFAEYQAEINAIEKKADRMCSSYEVVTGETLPGNTPFKLGAQQLMSATKFFTYVQQKMGLFLEEVFNEWLLPDFAAGLTPEHILDIMDDVDDIEVYLTAKKKIYQYEVVKRYILETNTMPDPAQIQLVGELVQDQIAKSSKQVKVEMDYYSDLTYSIQVVIAGENNAKKQHLDTLSSIIEIGMANPAALSDPRLMRLINMVLEESGYSPLELNLLNQTPTNPDLLPGAAAGSGLNGPSAAPEGAPAASAPSPVRVAPPTPARGNGAGR